MRPFCSLGQSHKLLISLGSKFYQKGRPPKSLLNLTLSKICEEFLQAFPDMKAHFMLLQMEPDGEPRLAIDEMAALALQRW